MCKQPRLTRGTWVEKSLPLLWLLGGGGAVLEPRKNKSPNPVMGSLGLREEECQGTAPVCPAPFLRAGLGISFWIARPLGWDPSSAPS